MHCTASTEQGKHLPHRCSALPWRSPKRRQAELGAAEHALVGGAHAHKALDKLRRRAGRGATEQRLECAPPCRQCRDWALPSSTGAHAAQQGWCPKPGDHRLPASKVLMSDSSKDPRITPLHLCLPGPQA